MLYPRTGTTKGEVLNYYAQVAPVLLPLLKDRPVTRVRWPNGVEKDRFFEKNAPAGTPGWVRTADVPTTGSRGRQPARRPPGVPDHRRPRDPHLGGQPGRPRAARPPVDGDQEGKPRGADRIVIDLDPGEGAGLHECCGWRCWCATRLPIASSMPARSPAAARACTSTPRCHGGRTPTTSETAKAIAEELQGEHPQLVTATMTKAKRSGKVFLDWSQNAGSKTTLSPYSLRGVERPCVATPVTWDEVEEGAEDPLGLDQFRYDEVLRASRSTATCSPPEAGARRRTRLVTIPCIDVCPSLPCLT